MFLPAWTRRGTSSALQQPLRRRRWAVQQKRRFVLQRTPSNLQHTNYEIRKENQDDKAGSPFHCTRSRLKDSQLQQIKSFREMSPYLSVHAGSSMVLHIPGEVSGDPERLVSLMSDLAILNMLQVKLVLVAGCVPQIDRRLRVAGMTSTFSENGVRITHKEQVPAVRDAATEVTTAIESMLQRGVTNAPVHCSGSKVHIATSNLVSAQPLGVENGVDHHFSGRVRSINKAKTRDLLDDGNVVLLSCLGYSPVGETYNIMSEDIASAAATELQAQKLIFLHDGETLFDKKDNRTIDSMHVTVAEEMLSLLRQQHEHALEVENKSSIVEPEIQRYLSAAVRACRRGVRRAHLVPRHADGGLLADLFTRDGVAGGLMISRDNYGGIRTAKTEDIVGIMTVLEPLEKAGVLHSRSVPELERAIDTFTVVEKDGAVVGCACLQPHSDSVGDLNVLAVQTKYQNAGTGDALLAYMTRKALSLKMDTIIVSSTGGTADWFIERGFKPGEMPLEETGAEDPQEDQQRQEKRSPPGHLRRKVYVKRLEGLRAVDEEELLLSPAD